MDLGLKGKTVFVAAASKGIGFAAAKALAREGAAVSICAREEKALMKAKEVIEKETGTHVFTKVCDVTREADIQSWVKESVKALGKPYALVTNAGGPPPGVFEALSDEMWEKAFQLNFLSAVRLIRLCLPFLKEQKGRIVNVVSVSVKQPVPNLMLSNAIRTSVVGFAKSLADEVGPYGVTVNNVCPGSILTDRMKSLLQTQADLQGKSVEEVMEESRAKIPLKRFGEPDEIASLIVFLCSKQASYITGCTIQVDGGMLRSVW